MINNNYNPNPIIIHAGLLRKNRNYSIFIWAEQKKHKKYIDIEPFKYPFLYSPFELKLQLFRQHKASFYGTFIELCECQIRVPLNQRLFYSEAGNVPVYHVPSTYETHLFPLKGIEIYVDHLQDYITVLLNLNATNHWKFADDFIFLQHYLTAILAEIKRGAVLPNQVGKWDIPEFPFHKWQKSAPHSFLSLLDTNYSLIDKNTNVPSLKEFTNTFIHKYISDIIKTDKTVNHAFHSLLENQPKAIQNLLNNLTSEKETRHSHEMHQQFLENIGAVVSAPFKLGIRIEEKKQTDIWQVTLFIHDRTDQTLMIDLAELLAGKHPWRENPITFFKEVMLKAQTFMNDFKKFSLTSPTIEMSIDEVYQFLTSNEQVFQQLGITILVPSWWYKKESNFNVTLKQNAPIETKVGTEPLLNWSSIADFDYAISVGGITITENEFHELVQMKRPIVKLRGKWVYWDVSTARDIHEKIVQYKQKNKLTYMQAYQLQLEEDQANNVRWQTKWNEKIDQLIKDISCNQWKKRRLPKALNGQLREYQHEGYSWLVNMRQLGFGACLADDMGLGKTIQTIAYLLAVKEEEDNCNEPFLLICPTSLIGNWEHELKQFAPSLKIYVHHGQNRSLDFESQANYENFDVFITSYSLSVRDEHLLTAKTWSALILDEAQHIKNIETKQRKSIKQIPATHRIALTGTPIENRLKELWSIIDLLNDHFLGSFQQFSKNYIKEIEGTQQNAERLTELKSLISPFLLRRTKRDLHIHLQLPSKKEIIHRVGLTVEQASLYQAVINDLFDKVDTVTEMERRALILSSLTKLKQICNHPVHYLKDRSELEHRSEKWEKLILLAETIASNNEKALIFSQYKEMGSIIKEGLESIINVEVPFLHGSLDRQHREKLIERFSNNDDIPFFILSLKAGGVGLNLTAATHVIHYDRWWNPAVENQATDRAYRIGQTENVTVHKLITNGTLEEKIHLMLEKKQQLSDQILNTNETKISELSTEDLQQFLKLRVSSLSS